MSRANVELDFFGMDKENSSRSRFQKLLHRQRSFRDIQGAISKINPELLKSVIASGSANPSPECGNQVFSKKSFSVPSTPKEDQIPFPVLPLYSPFPRPAKENSAQTAPLTIFYNGKVAVFDVPRDKAESILKLAEKGISKAAVEPTGPIDAAAAAAATCASASSDQKQLLETLDGDLPIARRKSLQRFLQKRKERLTSGTPYACSPTRF